MVSEVASIITPLAIEDVPAPQLEDKTASLDLKKCNLERTLGPYASKMIELS
jgi:hypothetical protein